jgi:hypothetical protein
MRVEGTIVDSIALAEPIQMPQLVYISSLALEVKRVLLRLLPTSSEMENPDLRSICRVLCAKQFSELYFPSSIDRPSLSQAVEQLGRILYAPQEAWRALDLKILGHIKISIDERCVCTTRKGCICLAPKEARPGDVVTVLLGCPNPMILRPTDDGVFKVVGEAYHDKLADGEALMGALPDGFTIVDRWNEQLEIYYRAFLNSDTGPFQAEDPRLSSVDLPVGWRKIRGHELEEWVELFNNAREGTVHQDPRLTAEALKQCGVDIQTFDLI